MCGCSLVNVFRDAVLRRRTLSIVVANRLPGQYWEFQGLYLCGIWMAALILETDAATEDNGVCKIENSAKIFNWFG